MNRTYAAALSLLAHGLLHLMAFADARHLVRIESLHVVASGPLSVVWLIAGVLTLGSSVLLVGDVEWWYMPALTAVILSGMLVLTGGVDVVYVGIANVTVVVGMLLAGLGWAPKTFAARERIVG